MTKSPSRQPIGVETALAELEGWAAVAGREAITRTYRFPDFAAALRFTNRAALAIETFDHHPEWSNVYNRVEVVLTTHSAGGVTALDVMLAKSMDAAAEGLASG